MILPVVMVLALAVPGEDELREQLSGVFTKSAAHYKALDVAATPLMRDEKGGLRTPHGFNRTTRKLDMRSIYWWTSGHFPGSLWYLYEATGDAFFKERAIAWTEILAPVAKYDRNHDVGFMMYCSFGNARRILKTNRFDALLKETAKSLSRRFDDSLGLIRSWGKIDDERDFLVIPDNMMNLELLEAVSQFSGDQRFDRIARSHATVTMKHHFRTDGGTYHVLNYDQRPGFLGSVQEIRRGQGLGCETAWSRGQSWAIYGYTMMYRFTKDRRYLDFAQKVSDFAINHPNMPADGVPCWDYGAPGEERDTSAASVMASALLELAGFVGGEKGVIYRAFAVKQLLSLASDAYFSSGDEIGHFLLKHGVGSKPSGGEVDTPLDYGDYYFLEALLRIWNTGVQKRVIEGGIEKFAAGRTPEEARASGEAAYERPVSDEVIYVDETMTLAVLNRRELKPGTRVLFKRGGVWRGQIVTQSGKPGHPIVYGAYGEGAKPCIQPSYDGSDATKWKKVGYCLWQIDVGAGNDIGNIIMNRGGEDAPAPNMCCFKRQMLAELKNDLDFCCEKGTWLVTMRSAVNPATRFKTIELSEKIHCVDETWAHDVVYEGLHFRYSAAHGIGGSNTKRITIRGCDVSWIGGGYLYYDKKGNGVRYGNGIEFWSAAEGHVVESNRVWECWDAGLTNQSSEDNVLQKDVIWRGNEVWNSEYSYEYWQQGADARTENVRVENNIFRDAGKGWGHRQRWNPNAAHLMFYDTTAETKGFVVKGNVFSRSEDCLFRFFNDWRANLEMTDNKWVAEKEPICRYHGRPTKDLVYKYPDRLDQMHDDNLAEIQSQGSGARVFKADEIDAFLKFMEAK